MVLRRIIRKDDKAVATVIGALLLTALAITFFTAYTLWYVPTTTTNNIGTVLSSQSAAYDSLSEKMQANVNPGELITQSFPLGYGGAPPFSQASDSTLSFLNSSSILKGSLSYSMNLTLKNTTLPASGDFNPVAIENITINAPKNEPSQYQQQLIVDSNTYKDYEAGNLQNIVFTYPNGTVIPSWLQCGNSNTSKDTVYWLNVHTNGTTQIQMRFYDKSQNMFNNFATGEAPNLTNPYGQYDDGANVFLAYFNGDTSPKDFNIAGQMINYKIKHQFFSYWQPYVEITQSNVSNSFHSLVFTTLCSCGPFNGVSFHTPIENMPLIVQSNFENNFGCIIGASGLVDNSNASDVKNAVSIDTGVNNNYNSNFEMQYVESGNSYGPFKIGSNGYNCEWLYSTLYYNNTSSVWKGSVTSSPIISSSPVINGTCTVNPLKSSSSLYMGIIMAPDYCQNQECINWMRAMVQPSGDKMPTYTLSATTEVIPYHPYVKQESGSFGISGVFSSTIDVGNILSNTYYLADGAVISYHGTTPVVSYGFPITFGNQSSNKSISMDAITVAGQSISEAKYGSSIVSLLTADTSLSSYQTGTNLTLLTTGLEPYTAIITYINVTALNYTVSGSMASLFNSTLYSSQGNGAKIVNDTWTIYGALNVTYRDNTFSITLQKGKILTIASISIVTTKFSLESL